MSSTVAEARREALNQCFLKQCLMDGPDHRVSREDVIDSVVLINEPVCDGRRRTTRAPRRPTCASSTGLTGVPAAASDRLATADTTDVRRRILLIAEDTDLANSVIDGLDRSRFQLAWQRDGSAGVSALRSGLFFAVVLDLALPHPDCLDVLAACRDATPRAPLLALAAPDTAPDRLDALDIGVNDYCLKPIDLDDMAARLRALPCASPSSEEAPIVAHNIALDPRTRTVRQAGQTIALSAREFDLLRLLMRHPGVVRPRRWLEDQLYRWGQDVDSNTVEVHVHHLRRKLGRHLIVTVRGAGYVVLPDGQR